MRKLNYDINSLYSTHKAHDAESQGTSLIIECNAIK